MRVCIDTNVLIRLFVPATPFVEILDAVVFGKLTLIVSTEILLEYEEVVAREFNLERWRKIEALFATIARLHDGLIEVTPSFRFGVVRDDVDDNKFVDCAIAGEADYIITYDHHFATLLDSGYKPRPITPEKFADLL
jgi:uncharacterized protein